MDSNGVTYTPQIIIGISANSDEQTKQDALSSGMDGFLSKPFEIDQLKQICSNLSLKVFI